MSLQIRITTLIVFIILNSFLFSQNTLQVNGIVLEKSSNNPMEYCTVSIYNQNDSSLVTGTITNISGIFKLEINKPGTYFLKTSYIGFETLISKTFELNGKNSPIQIGKIYLNADAKLLKEVEVTGTKSTIRYEMDKKVIDVGKDIAASNGSAVDVLESVPSVNVDINGTVKLRGSSNFMVLINGKPSLLSGSEALQQIPASNIKNIELITNPSAKYDAGNTSGIINIILKQVKKIGTSGMVKLSVGTFDNYSASVNLKHNIKKFGFNFSASIHNRNHPGESRDSLRTFFKDEITTITDNKDIWSFGGYSFKYGIDYNINKEQSLSFNFNLGKWGMYTTADQEVQANNISTNFNESYSFYNEQDRYAKYFGPSLSYNGSFKNKSTLSSYFGFSRRDFNELIFNSKIDENENLENKDKSTQKGLRQNITAKLDYSLPIKTGKLEIGGKIRSAWNDEQSNNYSLDLNNEKYFLQDINNDKVLYTQSIYGLYSTYQNKIKKFKYSLGLRAEYIDRNISFKSDKNGYSYHKWDFFPSASLSYTLSEKSNIYASYTRRIDRFPAYYLRPIPIKSSANSYFQGNPELKPRMVNSFELGWSNTFKKSTTLSIEAFYKLNTDDYRFISSIYTDSVSILNQPQNIGVSQNLGLETNLSFKPIKWWNIDLMGTGYYSTIKGGFKDVSFDKKSFEWSARFNNYFTITKSTKLQLSGNYRSRTITALGYRSGSLSFDLGLKQTFLKKALALSFNIRNVFYTANRESLSEYDNYYNYSKSHILYPFLKVGLSYKINNYRQSRRQSEGARGEF